MVIFKADMVKILDTFAPKNLTPRAMPDNWAIRMTRAKRDAVRNEPLQPHEKKDAGSKRGPKSRTNMATDVATDMEIRRGVVY